MREQVDEEALTIEGFETETERQNGSLFCFTPPENDTFYTDNNFEYLNSKYFFLVLRTYSITILKHNK